MIQLYLASSSPRRKTLLRQTGIAFACLTNSVEETRQPAENAIAYASRLAREKALAGVAAAPQPLPVLAADTVVYFAKPADQQVIFGKPQDTQQAYAMLRRLSGTTHQVITALAMADAQQLRQSQVLTDVTFRALTDDDIRRYVASGEPMDKAGAYAIQGAAACFIRRINGSYSAVMGLPLVETLELFQQFTALPTG